MLTINGMTLTTDKSIKKAEALRREGQRIVSRLQNRIEKDGYVENLGQKEARKFADKVFGSDLPYAVQAEIATTVQEKVLNL